MWSAGIDKARHLLQIKFARRVDLPDAVACAKRLEELVPELGPGFCLLNDLSEIEEMDLACEPVIDQMMDLLSRSGIRKVVRVIPEPRQDIGFGIMSLFHYGNSVRVVTCKTREEAERAINPKSEGRNPK